MPDYFYVYPSYLLRSGSRRGGRRVPASIAPPEADLEGILAVARGLGLRAEAEPGKQYPRRAFRYEGRVKIAKSPGRSKGATLRALAEGLQARAAEAKAGGD